MAIQPLQASTPPPADSPMTQTVTPETPTAQLRLRRNAATSPRGATAGRGTAARRPRQGGAAGRRARTSGPQAGAIDTRPARQPTSRWRSSQRCARGCWAQPAEHVRAPMRAGRESAFLCLVVDASGSMGARRRLARVKGALLGAAARRVRAARPRRRDRLPRRARPRCWSRPARRSSEPPRRCRMLPDGRAHAARRRPATPPSALIAASALRDPGAPRDRGGAHRRPRRRPRRRDRAAAARARAARQPRCT